MTEDDRPATGLLAGKLFRGVLVYAVVAVVAAAALGVWLWRTTSSDEYRVASARDAVVVATADAVRAYTEIDHGDPEAYREAQRAVSTAALYDRNDASWPQAREWITKSRTSVSVEVLDVGVLELNVQTGRADAAAIIERTPRTANEKPRTDRTRLVVSLAIEDGVWKLSAIDPVPPAVPGS